MGTTALVARGRQQQSLRTQVAILPVQRFLLSVAESWEEFPWPLPSSLSSILQRLGKEDTESEWAALLGVGSFAGRQPRGIAGRLALLVASWAGCLSSLGSRGSQGEGQW